MYTAPVIDIVGIIRTGAIVDVPDILRLGKCVRIAHGADRNGRILSEQPVFIISRLQDIFCKIAQYIGHCLVDRAQIVLIQIGVHHSGCEGMGVLMGHHIKAFDQPVRSFIIRRCIAEHLPAFHSSHAGRVLIRCPVFRTQVLQYQHIGTFSVRTVPAHIGVKIHGLNIIVQHEQILVSPAVIRFAAHQLQRVIFLIRRRRVVHDRDPPVRVAQIPQAVSFVVHDGNRDRFCLSVLVGNLTGPFIRSHSCKDIILLVSLKSFLTARLVHRQAEHVGSVQLYIVRDERVFFLILHIIGGIDNPKHLIRKNIIVLIFKGQHRHVAFRADGAFCQFAQNLRRVSFLPKMLPHGLLCLSLCNKGLLFSAFRIDRAEYCRDAAVRIRGNLEGAANDRLTF